MSRFAAAVSLRFHVVPFLDPISATVNYAAIFELLDTEAEVMTFRVGLSADFLDEDRKLIFPDSSGPRGRAGIERKPERGARDCSASYHDAEPTVIFAGHGLNHCTGFRRRCPTALAHKALDALIAAREAVGLHQVLPDCLDVAAPREC
jgi:hypothetical protein